MSYYALIVKNYNDGTAEKKSIYSYETEREALAAANKQFGQNIGASTIQTILSKVINDAGQDIITPMFWKASDLEAMKYYVLIIDKYNDGTGDETILYAYDDEDEASATTHTQYGSKLEASNIDSVLSTTINSVGGQPITLYWKDPAEESEG